MDKLSLALNAAAPVLAPALSLCVELPQDGDVPEWIELITAGARVESVDGRWWLNPMPRFVVEKSKLPRALDWEHATDNKAPRGEYSPAAGWIETLDGGHAAPSGGASSGCAAATTSWQVGNTGLFRPPSCTPRTSRPSR